MSQRWIDTEHVPRRDDARTRHARDVGERYRARERDDADADDARLRCRVGVASVRAFWARHCEEQDGLALERLGVSNERLAVFI